MTKIILAGYMGSGKTTVARLLHDMTGVEMLDLDEAIEKKTGLSIPDWFAQKGEIAFRKIEHETFRELMASDRDFILSLGGGTPCYANNHLWLNGDGIVSFYLKTSVGHLYERLQPEKQNRPLLAQKTEAELKEFLAVHLFERSFYYNQATHNITTDGKSAREVALEIATILA